MLTTLKRHFQDARTLTTLCKTAEDLARQLGRKAPASEHFVLAAFELTDGTARDTFRLLGLDKSDFSAAIETQRVHALATVGVTVSVPLTATANQDLLPPKNKLYHAEPSGQSLVQRLAESRHTRKGRELLGADVLLAAAQEVNSSTGRAFQELGLVGSMLASAAASAIMASAVNKGNA